MWKNENNSLKQTFEFKDFKGAIDFVNKVADLAEKHDHHPDIFIQYNKVTLTLTTHHDGSIVTEKDKGMAKEIDKLV
jgi:4a-hydroxytetrahydrobiopterin dehydratase